MTARVIVGDALEQLRLLPDESAHCCVTSPPYYGLRDYGVAGQIGLEATPDEYVASLVAVFREVRRVLRLDGTLWMVIGDSYNSSSQLNNGSSGGVNGAYRESGSGIWPGHRKLLLGLKPKDLIGIPWMLAFALRADGWYLREDVIWHKPNVMPESVKDRPTRAHEYVFLMSRSASYYYDREAIAEPSSPVSHARANRGRSGSHKFLNGGPGNQTIGGASPTPGSLVNGVLTRNKRSVWSVPTTPHPEAHFAVYPDKLIEPCILAGCPAGGTVLDPFAGSGTTGVVADRLGRDSVLVELSQEYAAIARKKLGSAAAPSEPPPRMAATPATTVAAPAASAHDEPFPATGGAP